MKYSLKWYSLAAVASLSLVYAFYPNNIFWLNDSDGDGLSDLAEQWIHKTNPQLADTDGDLLPDGFEVAGNLDPLVTSDISNDPDKDGLDNLSEAIYGTNPNLTDTDGDGTDDGVEASQGSSPTDQSDKGAPPISTDIVSLTLSVGDPSGSHSERYNLLVGPIRHQAPEFGKVSTRNYFFRKGKTYPISLTHTGTKPEFGISDFDWSAKIASTLSPPGYFYIDDSNQAILGDFNFNHETGALYFPAGESKADLYIPLIDIDGDSNGDEDVDEDDEIVGLNNQEIVLDLFKSNGLEQSAKVSLKKVLPEDLPEGQIFLKKQGSAQVYLTHVDKDEEVFLDEEETISQNLWETLSQRDLVLLVHGVESGSATLQLTYNYNGSDVSDDNLRLIVISDKYCSKIDEDEKYQLNILDDDGSGDIAIGESFEIDVVVNCTYPGLSFEVAVEMGDYAVSIPVNLTDAETGEFSNSGLTDNYEGPHYYHSKPVEVVHNADTVLLEGFKVAINDISVTQEFDGIRHLTALQLISDYVEKAKNTSNLVDCIAHMSSLLLFLDSIKAPEVYQYAHASLEAVLENATHPEIIKLFLGDLHATTNSSLNNQLRDVLDRSGKQMIDNSWWDDAWDFLADNWLGRKLGYDKTETRDAKRALVLLKQTALTNAVNRLTELNRLKRGDGKISADNYLNLSPTAALEKLAEMDEADDANAFTQINGIGNSDAKIDEYYSMISMHAKQKSDELKKIWAEMKKYREAFNDAQKQSDLFSGTLWHNEKKKQMSWYYGAERRYKLILGDYQILATMVEDDVPVWQIILNATNKQDENRHVEAAVGVVESNLREAIGEMVEMREVDELINLGSPRYNSLHTMVASLDAPIASSFVDFAKGQYVQVSDEKYLINATADAITFIAYGVGFVFPPSAYAAGIVDVVRSGDEVRLSYGESVSTDISANVGFSGTLEADKVERRYHDALTQLALDTTFGYGDVMALRRYHWRSTGNKPTGLKPMHARDGQWEMAKVDNAYKERLANQQKKIDGHIIKSTNKSKKITNLEKQLANLSVKKHEKAFEKIVAKRDEAKRLFNGHNNNKSKNLAKIEELKLKHSKKSDPKYQKKLDELEKNVAHFDELAAARKADWYKEEKKLQMTPEARLEAERAKIKKEIEVEKGRLAPHKKNISVSKMELAKLKKAPLYEGADKLHKVHKLQHAREGTHIEQKIKQMWARVVDHALERASKNPFFSNFYKLEDGSYMFGPKLVGKNKGVVTIIVKGKSGKLVKVKRPKLQYEVRNTKRIKNKDGTYAKPPLEVKMPDENGNLITVKTGWDSSAKYMEYDRAIFDHKNEVIFVEDITRSSSKTHRAKTWAYAQNLERITGYNATNIPIKNNIKWPRDIIYKEKTHLVDILKPDLEAYPSLEGKKIK